MTENRFSQKIAFRGVLMDAQDVIDIKKREMEEAGIQAATQEQLDEKKIEAEVPADEPAEEEANEKKIRLRQLLKDKGVKFFPGACVNTLMKTCDDNGITY